MKKESRQRHPRETAFSIYMRTAFKQDLERFKRDVEGHPSAAENHPEKCPHHRVPGDRVVALASFVRDLNADPQFWCGWYVSTLMNETVHRYARKSESKWFDVFGKYAIPMERGGLGCWRPSRPHVLLRAVRIPIQMWNDVCDYICDEGIAKLKRSEIVPSELIQSMLIDRDFDQNRGRERQLANRLRRALGNDGQDCQGLLFPKS